MLALVIVVLLGLLAASIMERRWEAQRPSLVLKPIPQWEPDNRTWGQNYPREYETYLRNRITDTKTTYGGAFKRDYLAEDPRMIILWSGYPFSKDYTQARGHYYSLADINATKRTGPTTLGTCWTCKSTNVLRLMSEMGVANFYKTPFADLRSQIQHPIGCQDCHDPATMNLRITRPALRDAFTAMGRDIDQATHQEMRSLVCAHCHVEYYFRDKHYLTFPWPQGLSPDAMLDYYEKQNFSDFTHAISGTPIIKVQHPDYELYTTGIHAFRGVSCADCHMPYITQGGVKFTNHHVQSPLLNISNSCSVCHRWSEDEVRSRVTAIQNKVAQTKLLAEDALVHAHFDVAAARVAGVADAALAPARRLIRQGQFRWDYVSSSNGMGFHSPQESERVLADAINQAQEARLLLARLLAQKGVTAETPYPDISTREKADAVNKSFGPQKPIELPAAEKKIP